jgi:hypothetical protein
VFFVVSCLSAVAWPRIEIRCYNQNIGPAVGAAKWALDGENPPSKGGDERWNIIPKKFKKMLEMSFPRVGKDDTVIVFGNWVRCLHFEPFPLCIYHTGLLPSCVNRQSESRGLGERVPSAE